MERIAQIISEISSMLWGWPMIILLLGTHIFLTVRLRFPQIRILKAIALSVKKDHNSSGDVSQFHALATSLAATIGTGNIIGVATAISLGGPGAVFWCWLTGIFGIATKYSEGLLAIKYRQKTSDGKMLGGPMYALEKGLNAKWLAVLFCIFTAVASFGIGNTVQANAISGLLESTPLIGSPIPTYVTGLVLAALVAMVIIFGVKGIGKVCGALVPFMALFYVAGCIIILVFNWQYIGDAISLIVKSAFCAQSAVGGMVGGTIMIAARYGIARGLFSNESGLGSAPIVAAAAQTRNPVRQAMVSSTATFWDTVVICAITGIVLVSSIIAHPDIDYADGAALTFKAFSKIEFLNIPVGLLVLSVGLVTFAFSTILGWSYYGERATEYLAGKRAIPVYRILWVIMVFLGAVLNLDLVWNISDVTNALMAIPNLISLLLLSGVVVAETRKYLWSGKLDDFSQEWEDEAKN